MAFKDALSRSTGRKTTKVSAADTIIRRKPVQQNVPFLKESVVPAGSYISEIIAVHDALTNNGKLAVDIHYTLTDAHGNVLKAKERFALDGYYFSQLGEALLEAGLPDGAKLSQAVGITERVDVVYPRPNAIGRIKNRTPYTKSKSSKSRTVTSANADYDDDDDAEDIVEEDDEFDDFLDATDDEVDE